MKTLYNVNISKFTTIEELPNAWADKNYIELLEEMDYGDSSSIDPAELREMCMMAITDNEPNEAAKILLDYIFKDELNDGQKDNLSHEMIDEKLWEQYAELSMHEAFFNIGQLLYKSYNGKFPHPEAVRFQATIEAKNSHDLEIFEDQDEATILRLITKGMPENTLINRLFKDDIEGEEFPEAKNIIWQLKKISAEGNSITFEIVSSLYWFHDLKYIESFEGTTHPDEEAIEE